MAQRAQVIKARVAARPATGGSSAPRTAGPQHAPGSGGTQAPASAGKPSGVGAAHGFQMGLAGNTPANPGPLTGNIGGNVGAGLPGGAPAAPHMPWDAQYELAAGGAEKAYGNTHAYLQSKKLMTQQDYGIAPGFNDYANNPFSRAALLRKSYDTSVRGSTNSYAAGGHLYGGSLRNAQTANRGQYDQGYNDLNKGYLGDLGNIDQEDAQALEDRNNKINEAGWQRLQTAQSQPLEPETSPETGNVNKKAKQKRNAKKKGK